MQRAQQAYMQQLWRDALGFGGCVMIRRIVGIAHVDDFRDIKDADARYAERLCTASALPEVRGMCEIWRVRCSVWCARSSEPWCVKPLSRDNDTYACTV